MQSGNNTVSNNTIYSLLYDRSGKIWIGNSKGIDVYDRAKDSFKRYKIDNQDFGVHAIYQDSEGQIWIGTFGSGLVKYDLEKDSLILFANETLKGLSISCIVEDSWGNLWFGTETNGLFVLNRNTMQIFSFSSNNSLLAEPFDFKNCRIRALSPNNNGNILIGTYDKGLYEYNKDLKKIVKHDIANSDIPVNAHISGIIRDKNGGIWISADGEGIFLLDKMNNKILSKYGELNNKDFLTCKSVRTIFIDSDQTLWAGTYKSGLFYTYELLKNNFHFYKECFKVSNITSIEGIDKNTLLIGTDGSGLYTFDVYQNKSNQVTLHDSINPKNILSIYKDQENDYLIGTFINGAIQIDKDLNLKQHFSTKNVLKNNDIRSIVSKDSCVYIATNGSGFEIFNKKTNSFSSFLIDTAKPDSGIVFNQLNTLYIDSKDFIWMGSTNGFTRMNLKSKDLINIHSLDSTNEHCQVNVFYEDQQGFVWIGTNKGLYRIESTMNNETHNNSLNKNVDTDYVFRRFIKDKEENIIVFSILEDNIGNLWLGTNMGLCRFNIKNGKEKFFYPESGVCLNLFNPNAAYKAEDGKLYFGGNKGLVGFYPDSITDFTNSPKLVFTNFLINMKPYKRGDYFKGKEILSKHINYVRDVSISDGAKVISIQFAATNSYLPKKIEYAYKLDKFDDNWNYISGNNLMATYTNLPPGSYTFLLKGKYSVEDWNNSVRKLQITILPPFRKTLWFRSAAMLALLCFAYVIYSLRINDLRKQNIRLEEQVTIKTKEAILANEARYRQAENNRQLILEKQQIENEKLRVEKEKESALNARLNAELELKNKTENDMQAELSASLAQISKHNTFYTTLKNELRALLSGKVENFEEDLNKIISKLDSENYFKDDWQKFENHFNLVYADFIKKLINKYPELTHKDLRLCSYIKMNLSTSEIAQLSSITIRGVEKSRNRLRKKLNLEMKADLNHFIINFEL